MRDTPAFGQWLGQRRKAFGLTQEELAERVSCSASLIRKLELGQRMASQAIAEALAELLEVAPEERTAFVQFANGRLSGEAARLKLWQTLHSHSARPQHSQHSHNRLVRLRGYRAGDDCSELTECEISPT